MTEREELKRLWSDPANWTAMGYRCSADPRLMVEKRVGIGYTINTAHRRSWLIVIGLLVVALAPTAVNVALGSRAPAWLLAVTLLAPITLSVVTVLWLMRRARD
jgi:hypothetical protein